MILKLMIFWWAAAICIAQTSALELNHYILNPIINLMRRILNFPEQLVR